jgi:multimeric flavodoxin WrbA
MKPETLIIMGSSRRDGNTYQLTQSISSYLETDFISLGDLTIGYYDYEHKNLGDDFIQIAQKMVEAKTIVLISPVYWYAVSAQMKTFIDRISDLITVRKDLGRQLRGKNLVLISNGASLEAGIAFDSPIKQSADYLGMPYGGHSHFMILNPKDVKVKYDADIKQLAQKIKEL